MSDHGAAAPYKARGRRARSNLGLSAATQLKPGVGVPPAGKQARAAMPTADKTRSFKPVAGYKPRRRAAANSANVTRGMR